MGFEEAIGQIRDQKRARFSHFWAFLAASLFHAAAGVIRIVAVAIGVFLAVRAFRVSSEVGHHLSGADSGWLR
jgi:hypothetical protein